MSSDSSIISGIYCNKSASSKVFILLANLQEGVNCDVYVFTKSLFLSSFANIDTLSVKSILLMSCNIIEFGFVVIRDVTMI